MRSATIFPIRCAFDRLFFNMSLESLPQRQNITTMITMTIIMVITNIMTTIIMSIMIITTITTMITITTIIITSITIIITDTTTITAIIIIMDIIIKSMEDVSKILQQKLFATRET
ncbi:hypothetical protein HNY73_016694 [Argiope bruennichi]|uniref:Uncharacterized protein n=1 Tax=Argiope bruennichi TaxID=94029 RepID=A0A8T0EL06_ARGBR|nr:hypothetical protein HNY73_016694 [Argiope bruennichi]